MESQYLISSSREFCFEVHYLRINQYKSCFISYSQIVELTSMVLHYHTKCLPFNIMYILYNYLYMLVYYTCFGFVELVFLC